MHDYQCVAHYEARGCDQYISVQLGLRNVNEIQFAVIADTSPCRVCHCEGDLWLHWAWRHVDLRRHILPSVESRCALRWLELSFLFSMRAITLQRCRIVLRGILGQYQYYYMFCLVTHIVGSNLKLKNQEVSGFSINGCSTLWSISMKFNMNNYQPFYLKDPNFHEICKSQSLKIVTFKIKSAITFAQGCMTCYVVLNLWYG